MRGNVQGPSFDVEGIMVDHNNAHIGVTKVVENAVHTAIDDGCTAIKGGFAIGGQPGEMDVGSRTKGIDALVLVGDDIRPKFGAGGCA